MTEPLKIELPELKMTDADYERATEDGWVDQSPKLLAILNCRERQLSEQIEKTRTAEAKYEHCKLQAETWAQEARTQIATVREIYALVGANGKGNFHGAEPVRAELASLRSSQAGLLEAVESIAADCQHFGMTSTSRSLRAAISLAQTTAKE